MGILLGLGDSQLGLALLGQVLAKGVLQALRTKGHMHARHLRIILGHAHKIGVQGATLAVKAGECRIHKGAGNLPGTVRPEVKEDHALAAVHTAFVANNGGQHKLIGQVLSVLVHRLIRRTHGRHRVRSLHALAVHHSGIGFLHTVPNIITVHGVETTHHRGDLTNAQFVHLGLELFQILRCRSGGHITAVQKSVHIHLGNALFLGHLQQIVQVGYMAVYATGRHKTHQVQGLVLGILHSANQHFILIGLAVGKRLGNAGQILVHHAAGAHIGVAHLAVAHLAVRQAHIHTGGTDIGIRALGHQLIQIGLLSHGNGIAMLGRVLAEAVHNAKHIRFLRHSNNFLSRIK